MESKPSDMSNPLVCDEEDMGVLPKQEHAVASPSRKALWIAAGLVCGLVLLVCVGVVVAAHRSESVSDAQEPAEAEVSLSH